MFVDHRRDERPISWRERERRRERGGRRRERGGIRREGEGDKKIKGREK